MAHYKSGTRHQKPKKLQGFENKTLLTYCQREACTQGKPRKKSKIGDRIHRCPQVSLHSGNLNNIGRSVLGNAGGKRRSRSPTPHALNCSSALKVGYLKLSSLCSARLSNIGCAVLVKTRAKQSSREQKSFPRFATSCALYYSSALIQAKVICKCFSDRGRKNCVIKRTAVFFTELKTETLINNGKRISVNSVSADVLFICGVET